MYRYYISQLDFERKLSFEILTSKDKEVSEVEKMVEEINHGRF